MNLPSGRQQNLDAGNGEAGEANYPKRTYTAVTFNRSGYQHEFFAPYVWITFYTFVAQ